jgi:hypothetical protein
VDARLRDRDPVQGAVELAVAAAVESMPLMLAGACFEWCDAGVAGELGVAVEAVDRADLAEQLGGAEWAAAGQREQPRCALLGPCLQLTVEVEDAAGQAAAAANELARDPDLDGLFGATQPAGHAVEPDGAVERARRDRERRVELVQLPAQPLLGAPPLVDQVVAMIDEQLLLAQRRLTRPRPIQLRLAQGRPGDRERVDRVGLTARTPARRSGAMSFGGTRTNDSPAASSSRSCAPVSRRQSSTAHSRSGPSETEQATSSADVPTLSSDSASDLVDGNRRQRLLVHVHSDHDHGIATYRWGRPASGQTSLEAKATLRSGHARRSREGGGDTTLQSQPSGDVRE